MFKSTVYAICSALSFSISAFAVETGVYEGKDEKGDNCWIQIQSSSERVDPNASAYPDRLEYTTIDRTIAATTNDQPSKAIQTSSVYSTMWHAYEKYRLMGDLEIEHDRREMLQIYLSHDLQKVKSFSFTRTPFFLVGVGIGGVERFCEIN